MVALEGLGPSRKVGKRLLYRLDLLEGPGEACLRVLKVILANIRLYYNLYNYYRFSLGFLSSSLGIFRLP